MAQINDDYYEDLTPESVVQLLDALKATAGTNEAPNVRVGPQKEDRHTCENTAGLTSLTTPLWGAEKTRADGEL